MCKRLVMGLVAMIGLVAIWQTDGEAATCIAWKTVGGSSFCTAWRTGTITLEVTFKEACLVGDTEVSTCFVASANATTNDSIAFCSSTFPVTPSSIITKVPCNAFVTFTGTPVGACVPKHEELDPDPNAPPGHNHHGCTQTVEFIPNLASCQSCCDPPNGPGGTCVDVTPVEMQTQVTIFTAGGGDLLLAQSAQSCAPDSFSCTFEETCTINPKKIAFHEERPYQCNLDCVGTGCSEVD